MIEVGFISIVAAVAGYVVALVAIAARRADRGYRPAVRVAVAFSGWLALTAVVSSGALGFDARPPRLFVFPWLMLLASLALLRSKTGREVIACTPPARVIALDVFRVGVEVVLWRLYATELLPVELTFEGRNFDILVGVTAIPAALVVARHPRLAVAWHVFGLAMLLNVVGMAVLSAPGPLHALDFTPANVVLGRFPFVWLPAFLVPIAALTHIVGLRQLREAGAARRSVP